MGFVAFWWLIALVWGFDSLVSGLGGWGGWDGCWLMMIVAFAALTVDYAELMARLDLRLDLGLIDCWLDERMALGQLLRWNLRLWPGAVCFFLCVCFSGYPGYSKAAAG